MYGSLQEHLTFEIFFFVRFEQKYIFFCMDQSQSTFQTFHIVLRLFSFFFSKILTFADCLAYAYRLVCVKGQGSVMWRGSNCGMHWHILHTPNMGWKIQLYRGRNNERLLSNHSSSINIPENLSQFNKNSKCCQSLTQDSCSMRSLVGAAALLAKIFTRYFNLIYIYIHTL